MNIKTVAKLLLSNKNYSYFRNLYQFLLLKSLRQAVKEQGLMPLHRQLSKIVPDLRFQYSTNEIIGDFLEFKVRAQHSFQIKLVKQALKLIEVNDNKELTIVDIGDSAGTHLLYLNELFGEIRSLSVNLDVNAVKKIKQKGLDAIHARAEELEKFNINADLFLSFQTVEHLSNPIEFLYKLSKTNCRGLVVTLPYKKQSRVALTHIRQNSKEQTCAEKTHIFELSPSDWRLIFQHSGWEIRHETTYLQYPKKHWLRGMRLFWKKYDFEGFYGVILKRNPNWSSLYLDW